MSLPEHTAGLSVRKPVWGAVAALGVFVVFLLSATDIFPWAAGLDHDVHAWILANRTPGWISAAAVVTSTASSTFTAPLVFLVAAALTPGVISARLTRAVLVLLTMLLAVLLRFGISELLARSRPAMVDWAVYAGGFSFPSGHTSDAALAAGLIAWLVVRRFDRAPRWLVWPLAASYALLIAWTRVYLGVHWPTDVLGSLAFVTAWLSGALVFQRLDERVATSSYLA
ncbi:phosphatase PAP2 family protein [Amycolatopsis sp. NPDC051758]|uniref:phosphatase PAP2 family protein n=1 Tax=Amycolatopsis sp. NPDC051758 TaxID=3363935 RepID=UPI003787952B